MPVVVTIWKLLRRLPPDVVELVVDLVRKVATSPDPKATAQRALEEAMRQRVLDEALKKKFG